MSDEKAQSGKPTSAKDDLRLKAIKKGIAWALKQVFKHNGIPGRIGGPLSSFYTTHAEALYRIYAEYDSHSNLSQKCDLYQRNLTRFNSLLEECISDTKLAPHSAGLEVLFFGVGDPIEIPKKMDDKQKNMKLVVNHMDVLLQDTISVLDITMKLIEDVNTRLEVPAGGNLEFVAKAGALSPARDGLCLTTKKVITNCRILLKQRNAWAGDSGGQRLDLYYLYQKGLEQCTLDYIP